MIDVAASGHKIPKKSEYNTVVKNYSNNIMTEIDNCVITMSNKGSYKPLRSHEKEDAHNLENNNNDNNNNGNSVSIKQIMIILSFVCVVALFLCHLSFPFLSMSTNSVLTTMNNCNVEIQFTIFIPDNATKTEEYQDILMDSFDIHVAQQKYDYKIISLKEENSFEQNTFDNAQVSKSK